MRIISTSVEIKTGRGMTDISTPKTIAKMISQTIIRTVQPRQCASGFLRRRVSRLLPVNLLVASLLLASFGMLASTSLQTSQAAESQQHTWVGDLPIMPAFSVEPALGFAFDSPNGRIVMVFASSAAAAPDIMRFYNESLQAIGWTGGDGSWHRGSEALLISEVTTAAGRLWQLMVRPQ
jgi:hypothetical protein